MDVFEIRRQRLKELMESRFNGSQTEMGRALSLGQSYLSSVLSDKTPPKNRKRIGEKAARHIEGLAGLEPGWLDRGASVMPYLSDEALEIAKRFDAMNVEQQAAVQAVLAAMGAPPRPS